MHILNVRMRHTRKTGRLWVGQALHNEKVLNTTRVVGHLVSDLAMIAVSTFANDVYSLGMVMLEAMHKWEKVQKPKTNEVHA